MPTIRSPPWKEGLARPAAKNGTAGRSGASVVVRGEVMPINPRGSAILDPMSRLNGHPTRSFVTRPYQKIDWIGGFSADSSQRDFQLEVFVETNMLLWTTGASDLKDFVSGLYAGGPGGIPHRDLADLSRQVENARSISDRREDHREDQVHNDPGRDDQHPLGDGFRSVAARIEDEVISVGIGGLAGGRAAWGVLLRG
jgi:hypothetical protein